MELCNAKKIKLPELLVETTLPINRNIEQWNTDC